MAMPTSTLAERSRAMYTVGHVEVIDLDGLDTHMQNRGGLGVSSFHAERIAKSIITDGFSRHRYRDATVVMVPKEHQAEFRKYNADMTSADPRLPPSSGKARFALLGKNHLVTALKILRAGSFTSSDTGEPLVPPPGDAALAAAIKQGIYCDVLGEGLWGDHEAIAALLAEDNLNASVEMGTNEMELLSFMSAELPSKSDTQSAKSKFDQLASKARTRFGATAFSDSELLHLHNYATRVPQQLVRNLGEMHFALVPASTLRCKTIEFDHVARVDRSVCYVKVALILGLYLGSGSVTGRAVGGVANVCKGISQTVLDDFEKNPEILQTVDLLIKTLLKHYPCSKKDVHVKKLLECRSKLYYRCGRLMMNWPVSAFEVKKSLASIETKYAKDMADIGALEGEIARKYPEPVMVLTVKPKEDKKKKTDTGSSSSSTPRPQRLVVEVLGDEADGAASAGSRATHVVAHAIPSKDVLGVAFQPWDELEPVLWECLVAEHLLHAHIMHSESVDRLQVVKAERTEPLVWQARAKEEIPTGQLMLVPYVKAAPELMEGKKMPFKRTPTLHPALAGHEMITVMAEGHTDEHTFVLRSPLDGKVRADARDAAPF